MVGQEWAQVDIDVAMANSAEKNWKRFKGVPFGMVCCAGGHKPSRSRTNDPYFDPVQAYGGLPENHGLTSWDVSRRW